MSTTTRPRPANQAGPHRDAPAFPPIDPQLVYPWRRLHDWGFGACGVAALVKAGLPVLRFGRLKFFSGAGLISVLKSAGDARIPEVQGKAATSIREPTE